MIPCCVNCHGMTFWDGDYVCTMHMKIHQYGIPIAKGCKPTGIWFDEDFERTLKTADECDDYMPRFNGPYEDMYEQEFVKYLIWKRLKKEHYKRNQG